MSFKFEDIAEVQEIRDGLAELSDRAAVIRMPALSFLIRTIGTAAAAGSLNRLRDHVLDWVGQECLRMESQTGSGSGSGFAKRPDGG